MGRWLEAFARSRTVSHATRAVQMSRTTIYEARESDPAFAAAWDSIVEETLDDLEDSMLKRAVDGWEEPVIYKGQRCKDADGPITIRKYSDALTQFAARTRRPARYNIATQDPTANDAVVNLAKAIHAALKSTEGG